MKRIKAGKLVLEREVLRRLSSGELGAVYGAGKTIMDCPTFACNGVTDACPYTAKNGCGPTDECPKTNEHITCGCPVIGGTGGMGLASAVNC